MTVPRILVVEDDPGRATLLTGLLKDASFDVDGPYRTASDGVAALASSFPDGAVLDLRSIAGLRLLTDDLAAYDIPFLVCADVISAGKMPSADPSMIARSKLDHALIPALNHILH